MNNLSASIKKFMGNKNTVTILGVIICIFVLYFGYNYRINQKVQLTSIPYANQTIQPRTLITQDMVSYMEVPTSFLIGDYYTTVDNIVGKYSNYNTVIANGSIFYKELLTDSQYLPDAAFQDVPEGYTVINYAVNMATTYANSMYPGNHINIYYKSLNDDGEVMFGKFIENIEILDVKDSSGQHVFENSEEARTPAYMLFAVPEETHLLLRKALYLTDYDVELILVPNTETLTDESTVHVTSEDIQKFIEDHTQTVDVSQLPNLDDIDNTDNNSTSTNSDDNENNNENTDQNTNNQ